MESKSFERFCNIMFLQERIETIATKRLREVSPSLFLYAENGVGLPTSGAGYTQIQSRIATSEKSEAHGVAELDANGLVPTS